MLIEPPKMLPEDLEMLCYACEEVSATHLCRYHVDDLVIQVCLCDLCMKIDTKRLLENTIGIQSLSEQSVVELKPKEHQKEERPAFTHSWSIHL
jgi:hypothetical protein